MLGRSLRMRKKIEYPPGFFPRLNQIYELHYLQFHQTICILVLTSYFIHTVLLFVTSSFEHS